MKKKKKTSAGGGTVTPRTRIRFVITTLRPRMVNGGPVICKAIGGPSISRHDGTLEMARRPAGWTTRIFGKSGTRNEDASWMVLRRRRVKRRGEKKRKKKRMKRKKISAGGGTVTQKTRIRFVITI